MKATGGRTVFGLIAAGDWPLHGGDTREEFRMKTWVIPFIYVAIMLAIYLLWPDDRRRRMQAAMLRDINFYLVVALLMVAASIFTTLAMPRKWPGYVAWGALVVASAISVRKVLSDSVERAPEDPGPL